MDPSSATLLRDILGAADTGDMLLILECVIGKSEGIAMDIDAERRGELASDLLQLVNDGLARASRRAGVLAQLTERERDIASLLECGMTNDAMAAALFVSERTVRAHLEMIARKLGTTNRTELVARLLGANTGGSANTK